MFFWGANKVASLLCNPWCFLSVSPGWIHAPTQNPARRTAVHFLSASKWQKFQVPKSSQSVLSSTWWLSVFQAVSFSKWRCGTSWLKRVVEGQHHQAGFMLKQTDCCSVLACGSSLTSSLFSKTETDSVKTSVAAVLETGAQGSCCLLAVLRLLLHPTLPSSGLFGYECIFPGHGPVCVYAIIRLFVCIHEKATEKPALAHMAHASFGEKLSAFHSLCFSFCSQNCTGCWDEYGAVCLKILGVRQEGAKL